LYSPSFLGPSPLWYSDTMFSHSLLLISSFYKQTKGKRSLIKSEAFSFSFKLPTDEYEIHDYIHRLSVDDKNELCRELFFSNSRIVVSHGTQESAEGPILNYGNARALSLWGASWEQFTTTPSRYTAEPTQRDVRDAFMKQVTENGIVEDYSGVRITADGKMRFRIVDAVVWNVLDASGIYRGQAATFDEFEIL